MVNNILPISTKCRINFHLNPLTQKHHNIRNPGPSMGQAQICERVKPVNGIPTISSSPL
jgi:hypothetical protein